MRSAIHPALFAASYKLAGAIYSTLSWPVSTRATLVLAAPKTLQAVIAAFGDWYTYKLARYTYGVNSNAAQLALIFTVSSPWNWFCSTRTFSNCLETTLTVIALYHWPYHWALGVDEHGYQVDENFIRIRETEQPVIDETTHLRRAILAASLATVLRPTNVVIWLVLSLSTFGRGIWMHGMQWEMTALIREGTLCSSIVLICSALIDRLFYETWTFPAWNFLCFNVFQSIAVFYGNNNWHYYMSQGYPLLLLVLLVPAAVGLFQAITSTGSAFSSLSIQSRTVIHRLALVSLMLPAVLSVLSHKEVRFIYPVLPALHVITAAPTMQLLGLHGSMSGLRSGFRHLSRISKSWVIGTIAIHLVIGYYFSVKHNSGIMYATEHVRHEFENRYLPLAHSSGRRNLTLAVLMPCHSLPWRSHLQYPPSVDEPGISGWALTCEPPLDLTPAEKENYLDEADVFYLDPRLWIETNMASTALRTSLLTGQQQQQQQKADHSHDQSESTSAPNPKIQSTEHRPKSRNTQQHVWLEQGGNSADNNMISSPGQTRNWPDYILFFAQLEPVISPILTDKGYGECSRFWNSAWHDDWRRRGDVLVWCVYHE